jgi:isocitrate/isopropylmalate dehydrogenase
MRGPRSHAGPPASWTTVVFPGDGIGPEIVGATVDVLREADRIFGLGLTLETTVIGFDSLRSAGAPSRIKCRGCDVATVCLQKGFQGPLLGNWRQPRRANAESATAPNREVLVISPHCAAGRLLLEDEILQADVQISRL